MISPANSHRLQLQLRRWLVYFSFSFVLSLLANTTNACEKCRQMVSVIPPGTEEAFRAEAYKHLIALIDEADNDLDKRRSLKALANAPKSVLRDWIFVYAITRWKKEMQTPELQAALGEVIAKLDIPELIDEVQKADEQTNLTHTAWILGQLQVREVAPDLIRSIEKTQNFYFQHNAIKRGV